MKKVFFLAFAVLTYYLAAMYHSTPLMMLFLAELILMVCMWLLVHYLKRCFTITLPELSAMEEVGVEHWYSYDITNRSRLPISSYRIRIRINYLQETRECLKNYFHGLHSLLRSRGVVKYLKGTSEHGTSRAHFGIRAPYCGMICLEFDRIKVYDYLALFSGKSMLKQDMRQQKMRIAVLPPRKPLCIEISSFEWDSRNEGHEKTVQCSGDAAGEVWQTHEYQAGDSCRHIHWKQSARTDMIWIKDYEKEINSCVDLLLEINVLQWFEPKSIDAFYRLLYSVILGLLEKAYRVKVHWYDGHLECPAQIEILDEGQCQDMFLHLFQTDFSMMNFSKLPSENKKTLEEICSFTNENYFKLDTGLGWYLNETLIYRFSHENLEQEITKKVFVI